MVNGFLSDNIDTIQWFFEKKFTEQTNSFAELFFSKKNKIYLVFDQITLHKKYNSVIWLCKYGFKVPDDIACKVAVIYKDKRMTKIIFSDYDSNEDSSVWFLKRFQRYKYGISSDIIECAIMDGPSSLDTICNTNTELQIMTTFKSKKILGTVKCLKIPEGSWRWFYNRGGKLSEYKQCMENVP